MTKSAGNYYGAYFRWINKTGHLYRPVKDQILNAVKEVILPVFEKLGKQKFLECFKNNMSSKSNEAYDHVLWALAPKDSYFSIGSLYYLFVYYSILKFYGM